MSPGFVIDWGEWINLALRWLHLTAGIAWIGSSFYFVWLDNHLRPPAQGEASGELWSVHGGGFYHNEKYLVAPAKMPADLHWFKWEAYFTWISGFSLLVLIYWIGAETYLVDPAKARISQWDAIAIAAGALFVGWAVYDGLCHSPLRKDNRWLGLIWFAFLVFAAWFLNTVFNARGAYLHVGAMIGSVMVGNVFFIIIPNQRKVVAALMAGQEPDPKLGAAAKLRSVHNNYMTLPVLFIMVSHHYPMTYGARYPWVVLALLGATGIAVRHVFNLRHRDAPTGVAMAVAAGLALVSVTYVSLEKGATAEPAPAGGEALPPRLTYADIEPILTKHCTSCHEARPTNPAVTAPPLGVVLDSYQSASAHAAKIKAMAVDSEVMPLGNATGMTRAERDRLGAWIDQGTLP
ncbi:urate hydroxylase PuuD [Novosphingobium aquimarinum]|uniref:urate hydroxylase PuuD n=1 Tax=Novosphingobium aquimarinum TaxID=2682494 RepID=UPI0012EBD50A|nr:urate hydroxylase PuuD [Novosphingobium aquimarinum]